MEDTPTPQPARSAHEGAAQCDLRLEPLALTLQQLRQASASLHDLEGRLAQPRPSPSSPPAQPPAQ